jgi:hypothetical protein
MQEFPPMYTSRSYWVKVCNVVLLLSYFHGHALYSGTQELIGAYAGMCKPTEAGKRSLRPSEEEGVHPPVQRSRLGEAPTEQLQSQQPTQKQQRSIKDKIEDKCVCM